MALTDKLTAIADAIRAKTGKSDAMTLEQMPGEIEGISGSGGSATGKSSVDITQPTKMVSSTTLASTVGVTLPSGLEYYYNHELLPEIPADVVANYPYLLIMRSLSGTIRLVASTEKAYHHTADDGSIRVTVPTTEAVYRMDANMEAMAWVPAGLGTSTYFKVDGESNWAVWWSNYDIIDQVAYSDGMYRYASEQATAEKPEDATHFYYNDARLPAIPVVEGYPYAFMEKLSNRYYIVFSTTKYFYNLSNDYYTAASGASAKNYAITFEELEAGGTWVLKSETADTQSGPFLWANYDIPQGSETATTIRNYGTPAVPA